LLAIPDECGERGFDVDAFLLCFAFAVFDVADDLLRSFE
jgi:hypothetical protein